MSWKRILLSYSPAPIVAMAKGIRDLTRERSSRVQARKILRDSGPIRLELGAGNKKGTNGWTTLDIVPGCDMYCDLAKGIPFPDRSVQSIYSSHFFEHLTYAQARILLDECLRVMASAGKFSICVPNARLYLEAYLSKGPALNAEFFRHRPAFNRTTKIDCVNYIAYMDGDHKYMFDEENLVFLLEQGGFKNVRVRAFDPALDLKERQYESIYAEGYK